MELSHFIAGAKAPGRSGQFADVFDPATGAVRARVPLASGEEIAGAVAAAKRAFPAWAATTPLRRARVMFRFKELIERHTDELAGLISAEHGKVTEDAKGSLMRGLEVVEFACGIPHLLKGEYAGGVGTHIDSYSLREPLGVCVGITPFNFPAMVPLWMFPIAIAVGNTFILKPSEKTPSTALRLAELGLEAGLPPGVLNVVHGGRDTVEALLDHPDVAAVSFVGSTPVAESVWRRGTQANKRVQALGGAKNHLVVMPDADMDLAVDALMGSAYGSAGERCMAVSVAVAVGAAGDPLVERLSRKLPALKVGPATDASAEMGPLITAEHRAKVEGYIATGVKEGAKLVVDGRGLHLQGYEKGFFLGPSLFDHVTPGMAIWREEIFGPVLSVVRAPDLAEATAIVNSHPFGNGAAILTRDGGAARAFVDRVSTGMVGVNVPIPVPMAFMSFGGWKRSLFGDHHIHGMEGVRFYTKLKTVTARWPDRPSGPEFMMPTMR
jgi:malonate-semialdehyde dehydrogenase (acetylating)/methylmalonate-semialdehyde dehydrogenase